jgi:hypothetical protein
MAHISPKGQDGLLEESLARLGLLLEVPFACYS